MEITRLSLLQVTTALAIVFSGGTGAAEVTGLDPLVFGMTQSQAENALKQRGYRLLDSGRQGAFGFVSYGDGSAGWTAALFEDDKLRFIKLMGYLRDRAAPGSEIDASACNEGFDRLQSILQREFGIPDSSEPSVGPGVSIRTVTWKSASGSAQAQMATETKEPNLCAWINAEIFGGTRAERDGFHARVDRAVPR